MSTAGQIETMEASAVCVSAGTEGRDQAPPQRAPLQQQQQQQVETTLVEKKKKI